MTAFFNTLSLKARIIASVVLLTVAGMGVLVMHVTSVLHEDVDKLLAEQLATTVNYVAADIDSKISMRLGILQEIARTVTPELMADPKQLQQLMDQRRISSTLFPMGGGVVGAHGVVNAEFGLVVPGRQGGVVKNMENYLKAMEGCKTLILPPQKGEFSHKAGVALVSPICNLDKQVIGALFGVVPLSDRDLFGQLEKTSTVKGSYLLVMSRGAHLIVSASDKGRILEVLEDGNPLSARRFNDGYEGQGISVNPKGVEVLSVSRNMINADWLVLAAVPTDTAFAPIANLKKQIFLSTLAMILAASVLLFFLLKKLLAPLHAAGLEMRRMTEQQGSLASLPIHRNDEIGQLIGNFNRLVQERTAAQARIDYIAHHDALTGLPNRLLIQDRFEQAAAHAKRNGFKLGLLFLDLDNFKSINDLLGHAVGDDMIKAVAQRLGECIKGIDTIGRLGGDEYLILLRDVNDAVELKDVLGKMLDELANPFMLGGRELLTSASIGVAVYPEDGQDFNSLCKKADAAMYQAKESGKNIYRFFDPLMNANSIERLVMRSHLKHALERNEFVLHYQPQIDLGSGSITGVEALIRWNHPEHGLVPPAKFIPIAEESGLIVPIGEWVLREACRQAVQWRNAGLPELVMAVNLSAVQLKRGDIEHTLVSAMGDAGLEPAFLELELTESILIKDTENVLQMVRRLKNLGVKLSIDDFGTGYSSLAYLKKFSVDKIKIDQSFVRDLAHDPEDAAIVAAIIQMASSLNLRTIAEGVEDELTLSRLRMLNCNEAQGYYFAKPMPAEEFAYYVGQTWGKRRVLSAA